MLASPW